jgi:SAM-dependent methyltransferase
MTAEVRGYYDAYWSSDGYFPNGRLTAQLERLLTPLISAAEHCLDVGCGDGRTLGPWMIARGASYLGVDVSANAVREARAKGLDARLIDTASSLPFADDTFDVVTCIEVFEHLFEPHVAASEIRRVLRPGGVLIATVPNVAYWRRRADLAILGRWHPMGDDKSVSEPWRDPHIRFFNTKSLWTMLARCGFDEVVVGGHGGSLIGDIPGLRKLHRKDNSFYGQIARIAPSLLCLRLHAVARKVAVTGPEKPVGKDQAASK